MKVVAISGISGSGKTSLVKTLSHSLSCPSVLFDDFVDDHTYPKDIKKWVTNGANVLDVETPRMDKALLELVSRSEAEYIFVEEPFGKCREPISALIDKVVLLDMPLEICLSRVIQRNIAQSGLDSSQNINQYLVKYNEFLRDAYIKTNLQTRGTSDLILNKVQSVEALEESVIQWLRAGANYQTF